ncbi:hypothetical protein [Bradyrhizobium sp. SZCCHNR3058]|uniref:hypothetical protein n=1 Tax=Bradyrhizobium sp. SZCCHNR3058 TaxID=3057423 RepID=UPI002915E0B6|nr:hypothetical protein [Bradyrhizobium sp. SZCCHNR3058]
MSSNSIERLKRLAVAGTKASGNLPSKSVMERSAAAARAAIDEPSAATTTADAILRAGRARRGEVQPCAKLSGLARDICRAGAKARGEKFDG